MLLQRQVRTSVSIFLGELGWCRATSCNGGPETFWAIQTLHLVVVSKKCTSCALWDQGDVGHQRKEWPCWHNEADQTISLGRQPPSPVVSWRKSRWDVKSEKPMKVSARQNGGKATVERSQEARNRDVCRSSSSSSSSSSSWFYL